MCTRCPEERKGQCTVRCSCCDIFVANWVTHVASQAHRARQQLCQTMGWELHNAGCDTTLRAQFKHALSIIETAQKQPPTATHERLKESTPTRAVPWGTPAEFAQEQNTLGCDRSFGTTHGHLAESMLTAAVRRGSSTDFAQERETLECFPSTIERARTHLSSGTYGRLTEPILNTTVRWGSCFCYASRHAHRNVCEQWQ